MLHPGEILIQFFIRLKKRDQGRSEPMKRIFEMAAGGAALLAGTTLAEYEYGDDC